MTLQVSQKFLGKKSSEIICQSMYVYLSYFNLTFFFFDKIFQNSKFTKPCWDTLYNSLSLFVYSQKNVI